MNSQQSSSQKRLYCIYIKIFFATFKVFEEFLEKYMDLNLMNLKFQRKIEQLVLKNYIKFCNKWM